MIKGKDVAEKSTNDKNKGRGELAELVTQLKKKEAEEVLGFARSIIDKRKK